MRYYEILKKRRTDLKLSIQDVSAQTRLAPEYIKAIEDNDLDVFSDDLSFVRYFIRSYCEALGVNWSMLQEEVDGSIKHYAHLRNMALTQAQKRMAASMPMDTNESRVRRTGRSSYQNRVASTSRSLSRKPRRKLSMKAVIIAGIILCGGFGLWAGMNQIRASQAAQAQAAADQEAKDKEAETARLAELRRREQGLDNAQPEQEEAPKVEDTTSVSGSTVTVTSTFDTPPEVAIEAKFSAPSTVWLTEAGAVLNDTSQYTDSFSQTVTMNAPGTLLFQPAVPEGMKLTVNGQTVTPELNENGEAIITIEVVQAAGAAKEELQQSKESRMNLPNKLTLVRILMVPAAAIIYLAVPADWAPVVPSIGLGGRDLIVFAIFAIASFTDFLDGNIARSRNLITSFGKFADPIADKLLVNTLLILLAWSHQASVAAVLLMTARDLIVDGLRMSAAKSGEVVSAGWWGKVKTVLQMLAIALLLLHNWPFALIGLPVAQILLWAACAASLYSGWIYFEKLKKYVLETM